MTFNPGDSTGVCDEIDDICQSDSNSYPLKSKARRVNAALDRFFTLSFRSDGRWSFDDSNQTTAPIVTVDLVSDQEKYALDAFVSEIIDILRVEILDSTGVGTTLTRLDKDADPNVGTKSLPQFNHTHGTPTKYDLLGKYIYLYPKPSYNSSGGLSLYINRNKSAFVSTDTTKSLGVPSIFHQYICRLASLPYLIEFQKGQKNDIASQIQSDENEILSYFKNRTQFTQKMKPFAENNR